MCDGSPFAAEVILAAGGTFTGTTSGASMFSGLCGAGAAGPEQVFEWTPAQDGIWNIETCGAGTNFDTVLYLREASCPHGPEVACNDDACQNSAGNVLASRITPTVTAGQTYLIIVDGFAPGSFGNFTLTVSPMP